MPIAFTQYLRPDGRETQTMIDRPPEIEAAAHKLTENDCVFEIEVLSDGMVSMTCECVDPEDGDHVTLAHEIVANGPKIPAAVDVLVREATKQLAAITS